MNTAILRVDLAPQSQPIKPAEPTTATVLVVAAATLATVSPTLVALTHGWDYRLATIPGAWVAVACFVFGRRMLAAEDVEGRLSMEYGAASGATQAS